MRQRMHYRKDIKGERTSDRHSHLSEKVIDILNKATSICFTIFTQAYVAGSCFYISVIKRSITLYNDEILFLDK